jgi:hypothetical protein
VEAVRKHKLYLTTTDFLPGGTKTLLVGTSIMEVHCSLAADLQISQAHLRPLIFANIPLYLYPSDTKRKRLVKRCSGLLLDNLEQCPASSPPAELTFVRTHSPLIHLTPMDMVRDWTLARALLKLSIITLYIFACHARTLHHVTLLSVTREALEPLHHCHAISSRTHVPCKCHAAGVTLLSITRSTK